jgi:hypothetical protein
VGGEETKSMPHAPVVKSKIEMLFEPWFEIKTLKKKITSPEYYFLIPYVSKTHKKVSYLK